MAHYAAHFNQTHVAGSGSGGAGVTIPSNATAFQTSSPRASLERESNKSFGVDLAIQLAKEGHQRAVPRLLERCVEAIERAGGLEVVGLYRLSGTTSKIARLKARLDAGLSIQLALSLSLLHSDTSTYIPSCLWLHHQRCRRRQIKLRSRELERAQ